MTKQIENDQLSALEEERIALFERKLAEALKRILAERAAANSDQTSR